MRRNALLLLPVLGIVLSLWAGMHYYVFVRLARDPELPGPAQGAVAALLVAGAVSVIPAFSRALPAPVAGWLHLGAFGWMGALFLFDTVLAAGDLVRALVSAAHATTGAAPLEAARTQALVTALLGLGIVGYAFRSARRDPPLKTVEVRPHRWPGALDGLKIVQLSDVHVSPDTDPAEIQRLVDRVNALEPELVALTGDLVDGSTRLLRDGMAPLANLRARHGVFAVTGNHEYYSNGPAWIAEFRRLGFRVLQNERVTIGDGDAAFDVVGVTDWTGAQFGEDQRPRLSRALEGRDPSRPAILLAHQPRQFPEAVQRGVSLQLSGHTHGGQIWPFTLLVALAERHVAGLHRAGDSQLYVSRGTRYWGPPMRLGAPHELTLLTLRAA